MSKQNNLCVLLDANIIIQAHANGVWNQLTSRVTLVIPSTVVAEATHYLDPDSVERREIHLDAQIVNGAVIQVAATADQLADLYARFNLLGLDRLDPGEAEVLALLLAGALPEHSFCTADGPAIRALAQLDLADTGISFEMLLSRAGLQQKLPHHYTEKFFRDFLARGAQDRIQGQGLASGKEATPQKKTRRNPKRK